jgi:predicted lipoprotein with Yx(FWY)xxD motif
MTMNARRTLLLPSVVAIAAIAAACSSGGGAATTAPSVAAPTTAASAPASTEPSAAASEAASPAAAGVSLALADSKLGKIIVDGQGKTLYMFTPDEDAGGKVTCYDQCAASWPALKADDAASVSAGTGLDATKISVVDRTDGGKQVKYGEYPLYFFAKDAAAGDVNGQGVGGKWYVVGADGEPIKTT